ncbi:MAG: MBL fold metallo-hydrolase [Microbacterium sp.]
MSEENVKLASWQIGDIRVTRVQDCTRELDLTQMLIGASAEALDELDWLRPDFLTPEGLGISSYHSFVLDTPDMRVLVDTGWGDDKNIEPITRFAHRKSGFLEKAEAAGFDRDSVDVVVCTHLHVDHVGFNTVLEDSSWVPTFPRARYIFVRHEFDAWKDRGELADDDWFGKLQSVVFRESVQPVVDAGQVELVDLVDGEYEICDGVAFVSTPGHSPAHASIRVRSGDAEALILGDMAHHPSQLAHPDWGISEDHDGELAARTRWRIFADAADRGVLLMGTHWPGRTAGHIVRDRDAFRLERTPLSSGLALS